MDTGLRGRLLLSVVSGLELVRWNVADGRVEPGRVPPVHPAECGQLDVFDGPPRATVVDELTLVEANHRLGQCVVVAVALDPTEVIAPSVERRSV